MDVFYDRLKLGSTAALDCHTGQNKQVLQKRALIAIHLVDLILDCKRQCHLYNGLKSTTAPACGSRLYQRLIKIRTGGPNGQD